MNFENCFPLWNDLNTAQKKIISDNLITQYVKKGTIIHNGNLDCTGLLLVKSGQLRTYILSDEGREITLYRLFDMDMVRAGITLYGLWPSEEVDQNSLDLKPVMELKTHVAYVKDLEAGRAISYGGTFITKRDSRIATIPVGYADGYCRGLSNTGSVLIHGKRAPICGRVCMDQFMVDVTDIPDVKIGDEVTLIGRDGDEVITMEEVGSLSGRFNYEFVCVLGKRIPRVFYRDGKRIASQEYFDEE